MVYFIRLGRAESSSHISRTWLCFRLSNRCMDFHCLLVHVNFTRLNKIEATYGSSRVNVQVGPRSTFTFRRQGGSLAEWSARRPAVLGSSSALGTCWISSRSSRVEIVGHGVNSQLVASCLLGFLILLCCIEWFVSKYLTGVSVS